MKNIFIYLFGLLLVTMACEPELSFDSGGTIYRNEAFAMYPDRIEQDSFTARALDSAHIISNYQSPARTNYPNLLSFKFALNGKDNEAPSGQDHQLRIMPKDGSYTSPIIVFGEQDPPAYREGEAGSLSPNTNFTVRLDLRQVLKELKQKGYYTTYSGEQIRAEDFDGVYIAGGSAPLSWDFDNLYKNPDYQLQDPDGDGIYEATYVLNPHDPEENTEREWKLSNDISNYPSYRSDQVLVDALYNMALDETKMLIEDDGTFRTGAKWEGVWTRDISYSVILAFAYLEPEIAKTSLLRKVKNERIIQDTGSGGAWPISTDREVWAIAAWEIYLATGDENWLQQVYPVIRNSLNTDLETIVDEKTGLMKGESSFLDWREQTYPAWMDNVDISQSLNLGTNAVFYQAFRVAALMAERNQDPDAAGKFNDKAETIRKAINQHLWNADKGYYNQYLYGRHFLNASPRAETLGESLTILFEVAADTTRQQLMKSVPVLPYGVPSIYPQIPFIPPYHNNGIWPFVQAYWNWAARKAGDPEAVMQGLAAIYRPAALFLTNKENFVAENGDFIGTEINSDRQLWSVAGNLAMVYRVLLGMEFTPEGLEFSPMVPEELDGLKRIEAFRYRNALLDIELEGFGSGIAVFELDGKQLEHPLLPADLEGNHQLRMVLDGKFETTAPINLVENIFSTQAPTLELQSAGLKWQSIPGAAKYQVYRNGQMVSESLENSYNFPPRAFGQYKVLAVDSTGYESFSSEPVDWQQPSMVKTLEVEDFAPASNLGLVNYQGSGYVKIVKNQQEQIKIPISVDEAATYLLSFRYSNGSGPWNTDNKSAIRTLKVDGEEAGTLVMAQRGAGEWSNWGYTNLVPVKLEPGTHQVQIVWESSNENMNVEVNEAVLDQLVVERF